MEVEVVVCSSSGKPIYHFTKPSDSAVFQAITTSHSDAHGDSETRGDAGESHSFVSSLQGLVSFIKYMQNDELQEIESNGCRCAFRTVDDILTYAVIVRGENNLQPSINRRCLLRLMQLIHSQIVFILSGRGLDVLRKQPNYDLRELLIGTDRVIHGLSSRWAYNPAYRFHDFGVPFVRIDPEDRAEILQTIEYEANQSAEAAGMICGMLLGAGKVITIAQPRRKQFSILVDDLLLLMNFIYETPSFRKSETWTPVCLPSFNSSGFLHAYIAFLGPEIALVLLSTQQSPEQFHHFQGKRVFIENNLKKSGTWNRMMDSMSHDDEWKPHHDLPLLHHFVYKNELTGECVSPTLDAIFSSGDPDHSDGVLLSQLVDAYARLEYCMYTRSPDEDSPQILGKRIRNLQTRIAARMVVHRTTSAVYVGVNSDDHRLLVWFDALGADDHTLEDQCQLLLDRLKRDDELMSISLFSRSASLWP